MIFTPHASAALPGLARVPRIDVRYMSLPLPSPKYWLATHVHHGVLDVVVPHGEDGAVSDNGVRRPETPIRLAAAGVQEAR